MSHVKTTFPAGWYHFRCTQVDQHETESSLVYTITFTCDTGERSYQHIISTFVIPEQTHLLQKMITRAGFTIYGEPEDDFYVIQFLGLRCEGKVDTVLKIVGNASFITNIMVDWKPPVVDPEWNVMKPKSDDNFFKTKNKKRLPI